MELQFRLIFSHSLIICTTVKLCLISPSLKLQANFFEKQLFQEFINTFLPTFQTIFKKWMGKSFFFLFSLDHFLKRAFFHKKYFRNSSAWIRGGAGGTCAPPPRNIQALVLNIAMCSPPSGIRRLIQALNSQENWQNSPYLLL